jgi:hypothetical protein
MSWFAQSWFATVDIYCERTGPEFWSEPVNALTNAAFLIAAGVAFVQWRRVGGNDRLVLALIVVAALIGLGSFAFHTFAMRLAALADTIPIAIFIYLYLFLALRRFLKLSLWTAIAVLIGFGALSYGLPLSMPGRLPGGLAGYLPALCALLTIGWLVRREPAGKRMLVTGCVFAISLTLRTVDAPLCEAFPLGTHFLWHVLNALVLYLLLRAALSENGRAST